MPIAPELSLSCVFVICFVGFRRFVSKVAVAASGESSVQQYDYDLFTIGAGSGGVRGSRIASSYGEVMYEPRSMFLYVK